MGGSERSVERFRGTSCALRCIVLVCVSVVLCAAVVAGCGASSGAGKASTRPEQKGDDGAGDSGDAASGESHGDSSSGDAGTGTSLPDFGDSPGGVGPDVADGSGAGDAADPGTGAGSPGAKPAADPAKDRFKTKVSPVRMSAFLEKPAAEAMKKQQWAKAVTLYQALTVARGDASPEALQLATAWTLVGQNDDAIAVLDRYVAASNDPEAIRKARRERDRLAGMTDPFETQFKPHRASKEAGDAFKEGRKAAKSKDYADALLYFRMGYALDPDLPGFLRELGYTYDKMGAKQEKIAFFQQYLLARPFGKNADEVRKAMAKEKGAMGKLDVDSPLPCDEVWINRQLVGSSKKLPIKQLLAAPGEYLGLCVSARYAIGIWERARVAAGKTSALTFRWAIVVNELTNPHGRVSVENYRTGQLYPLRIGQPEIGVAVPPDGRALRVKMESLDGQKRQEKFIKLQPGAREVIKW